MTQQHSTGSSVHGFACISQGMPRNHITSYPRNGFRGLSRSRDLAERMPDALPNLTMGNCLQLVDGQPEVEAEDDADVGMLSSQSMGIMSSVNQQELQLGLLQVGLVDIKTIHTMCRSDRCLYLLLLFESILNDGRLSNKPLQLQHNQLSWSLELPPFGCLTDSHSLKVSLPWMLSIAEQWIGNQQPRNSKIHPPQCPAQAVLRGSSDGLRGSPDSIEVSSQPSKWKVEL